MTHVYIFSCNSNLVCWVFYYSQIYWQLSKAKLLFFVHLSFSFGMWYILKSNLETFCQFFVFFSLCVRNISNNKSNKNSFQLFHASHSRLSHFFQISTDIFAHENISQFPLNRIHHRISDHSFVTVSNIKYLILKWQVYLSIGLLWRVWFSSQTRIRY